VNNLLRDQWRILDPKQRRERIGQADGSRGARSKEFRRAKLLGTRQKVELVASQSNYQDKIRQSYKAKENRYRVEFHKKFAIPVACLVFVLLGIPMAVTTARSGRGISVSLALACYLIYYLFLVGGEKLADRGRLDPLLSMWMANIVLTAVGIPLFLRTVRESTLFSFTLKPKPPASSKSRPLKA
jgi:lipopolysaccharide export system permease protein